MNIIIIEPRGFCYGVEASGVDWIQSEAPTHIAVLDEIPEAAGTYSGSVRFDGMSYYSENTVEADAYFYPEDDGSFFETLEIESEAATVEISVSGIGEYSIDFFSETPAEETDNHVYGCEIEQVISSAMPEAFILSQINRELKEAVEKHPELSDIQNLIVNVEGDDGFISFDLVKKTTQIINGVEVRL